MTQTLTTRVLIIAAAFALIALATPALACRIPVSGVVRTEAQQDAYELGMVDLAAIAVITRISATTDGPLVQLQNRETLRGGAPERFVIGDGDGDGLTDLVLITCYTQRPRQDLLQSLREGDEVLVFSDLIAPAIPFDVLSLDDPRAHRLLALLRSERTIAQ
jgi:hypothetical protein